ncbi:unnamed protein product [Moneuplotes crassus]|uniref:Uncharacterized protein n=1 Tax=Euplotes crassus TaxID=5936 RepID=A0AAD1XLI1_EUPCR|nr:unnamed protein product [Moneuplotes crassus]
MYASFVLSPFFFISSMIAETSKSSVSFLLNPETPSQYMIIFCGYSPFSFYTFLKQFPPFLSKYLKYFSYSLLIFCHQILLNWNNI